MSQSDAGVQTVVVSKEEEKAMPVVSLRQVDVYQGKHLILNNVFLEIEKASFVFLIGKTGSGKSSLVKTIYGELPLVGGEGTVAGYNLGKLKKRHLYRLRRRLGMVFQDFNLLSDRNVENNLNFVLKATGWKDEIKMKSRVDEVLRQVGMHFMKHKLVHELSGGEQQRVAIARAMLNYPELLIADEPTGNLDPDTADDIVRTFYELSRKNGTAVLFTTHNYKLLQEYPARVIRCHAGGVFPL